MSKKDEVLEKQSVEETADKTQKEETIVENNTKDTATQEPKSGVWKDVAMTGGAVAVGTAIGIGLVHLFEWLFGGRGANKGGSDTGGSVIIEGDSDDDIFS